MQIPEVSLPLLRNIFVKPVQPVQLQQKFPLGSMVHGRIIQILPQSNAFVLHVNGLNLIAKSHLSLFRGDRILGKVQKNQPQVELKLVEVNGHEVNQNLRLFSEEAGYAHMQFLPDLFGEKSYLEIYPDRDTKSQDKDRQQAAVKIILNSSNENSIVADLRFSKPQLSGAIWFENQGLLEFFNESREEIEKSLLDDRIETTQISFLPLQRDIGLFRREWLGSSRLDVRA